MDQGYDFTKVRIILIQMPLEDAERQRIIDANAAWRCDDPRFPDFDSSRVDHSCVGGKHLVTFLKMVKQSTLCQISSLSHQRAVVNPQCRSPCRNSRTRTSDQWPGTRYHALFSRRKFGVLKERSARSSLRKTPVTLCSIRTNLHEFHPIDLPIDRPATDRPADRPTYLPTDLRPTNRPTDRPTDRPVIASEVFQP